MECNIVLNKVKEKLDQLNITYSIVNSNIYIDPENRMTLASGLINEIHLIKKMDWDIAGYKIELITDNEYNRFYKNF